MSGFGLASFCMCGTECEGRGFGPGRAQPARRVEPGRVLRGWRRLVRVRSLPCIWECRRNNSFLKDFDCFALVWAGSRRSSRRRERLEQDGYGGNLFERLVYLASLRNPDNGRYEPDRSAVSLSSAVNQDLTRWHEEVFREWVTYTLERKKTDIELYIAGIELGEPAELIDTWLRLTPYKNLVPAAMLGCRVDELCHYIYK